MIRINRKNILAVQPSNNDRISFFYRKYQQEPNPNKKIYILKKIQLLQEKK